MTTINSSFTMTAGDGKTLIIGPVIDTDGLVTGTPGNPIDLTTGTLRWTAATLVEGTEGNPKFKGSALIGEKTEISGITFPDGGTGAAHVLLDPSDTTALGGKTLYHELQVTLLGIPYTVAIGSFIIRKELLT